MVSPFQQRRVGVCYFLPSLNKRFNNQIFIILYNLENNPDEKMISQLYVVVLLVRYARTEEAGTGTASELIETEESVTCSAPPTVETIMELFEKSTCHELDFFSFGR